jgi:hypothetical protein
MERRGLQRCNAYGATVAAGERAASQESPYLFILRHNDVR